MSDEYTNWDAQIEQLDETSFFGLARDNKYIANDGQPTAEEKKWHEESPKCIRIELSKC